MLVLCSLLAPPVALVKPILYLQPLAFTSSLFLGIYPLPWYQASSLQPLPIASASSLTPASTASFHPDL
jgi:hypothetical protein